MNKPTAIILLAGSGTRLKPLTDNCHKSLLDVQGQSILQRQIASLQKQGIEDFAFVLGHRHKEVKSYIQKNFSQLKASFHLNEIPEQTNTAYSLLLALEKLQGSFLLLDGDVLLSQELYKIICQQTNDNLLLCETAPEKLDDEAVKVQIENISDAYPIITQIGKPVPMQQAAGESIGVGLYQADWNEALTHFLKEEMKNSENWKWYYEDAIQIILNENQSLSRLKLVSTGTEPWVEIDDHTDWNVAHSILWDSGL